MMATPLSRLLAIPGFVALLWLSGFMMFILGLPSHVEDVTTHTDAVVVLTGGKERLNAGIVLLDSGMADRLFVSGVHKGVDISDILRADHLDVPKELAARIELGHRADDTVGNAEETLQWVRINQVRSLRLVTAGYHMRRSLWEFRQVMPDLDIVPHPVFPEHGHIGPAAYTMLLASEYSKYAVAVIRNRLRRGAYS